MVCGLCERGANELRVCVYVSGVGMCVCAVCRWGVCAGMPVVRRVRLWLWVWRVGGGVRRGETARQRTRQCVCVFGGGGGAGEVGGRVCVVAWCVRAWGVYGGGCVRACACVCVCVA